MCIFTKIFIRFYEDKMIIRNKIYRLLNAIDGMGIRSVNYFRIAGTLTVAALLITYFECWEEMMKGSVGLDIYYAPYIERIIASFVLFCTCTFIIDLTEKETIRRK